MRTTTILSAYIQSKAIVNTYGNDPWTGEPSYVKFTYIRKIATFRSALLRRIEAGDRAREALQRVEWTRSLFGVLFCSWCDGIHPNHAPDCPRQIALGMMP